MPYSLGRGQVINNNSNNATATDASDAAVVVCPRYANSSVFHFCLSRSLSPFSVLRIINKILSKNLSKKVRQQQLGKRKSAFHLFTSSASRRFVSGSETTPRVSTQRARYKLLLDIRLEPKPSHLHNSKSVSGQFYLKKRTSMRNLAYEVQAVAYTNNIYSQGQF